MALLEDLEHVNKHLVQLHEVCLSEVVTRCACVAIDYLLFEVFKGSQHVPLEEVHRYQNPSIHDIQRQFIHAFTVLKSCQKGRTEFADIVDQLIDVLGLKVSIVLREHGGDLTCIIIEVGTGLVERCDEVVVGLWGDGGVQGVGRAEGEVGLEQLVLRSHQFCGFLDDCVGGGEEVAYLRCCEVVDEVDDTEEQKDDGPLQVFLIVDELDLAR